MTVAVTHAKVATLADEAGAEVNKNEWNEPHVVTGLAAVAESGSYTDLVDEPTLASGVYLPTLTAVANVAASTAYQCQWSRVGNIVTVSGKLDLDPVAPAADTQLGIELPVVSNLAAAEDCAGAAFASGIAGQGAAIRGDALNNRAELAYVSGDITNQSMFFLFQYEVL